ncbi:hypothetical protein [Geoalkalibacter sp.]|uniref:hypothetical protein n=1 Tax=Geoalkalibacter sp. TaxID=3041440 RepID=UPI00272DED52|nr:hypothetical protein [Geoalkalibacter sp.]
MQFVLSLMGRGTVYLWVILGMAVSACAQGTEPRVNSSGGIYPAQGDRVGVDSVSPDWFFVSAQGGQIDVRTEDAGEEVSLLVDWIDEQGRRLRLWQAMGYVPDPEQAQPWVLVDHHGIEFFALSIFSAGARCCWEILLFRLDRPQLLKRGFASGAAPRYLSEVENCPLAARIYPVGQDGVVNWEPRIECLVEDEAIHP